ncbi:hypothetical protein EDL98_02615 [Ornithobacterium rhinotracheale]|nr:hypothetical protein [Ornithobacterium rhinotracheale]
MPTHKYRFGINNYTLFFILCLMSVGALHAQTDSISAKLIFEPNSDLVQVEQHFDLPLRIDEDQVFIYAWVNAYRRKSVMSRVKLRGGNEKLYFAKNKNLGGIYDLKIYDSNGKIIEDDARLNAEVFKLKLKPQRKRFRFFAKYKIKLPADGFTGYGYNEKKESYFFKYFLLHPGFYEDGKFRWQSFKDLESLSSENTYYRIKVVNNTNSTIFTDLQSIGGGVYEGDNRSFFELALLNPNQITEINVGNQKIIFQEKIPSKDSLILKKVLSKQLNYLQEYLPPLSEPLFVSSKLLGKEKQNFIDDVKIPLFGKYKIYQDSTRLDLKYLPSIISAYCDRSISVDKRGDHWLLNGFKSYLALQYLKRFHLNTPIAGKVPEDLGIWKIHPLHWYESSKFGYIDRYPLYHRYFMKQNIDQPIDTPYDQLRSVNQKQVSSIKTGLAFDYLAEYLPKNEFDRIFKEMIETKKGDVLTKEYFKDYLMKHSSKDLNWFFDEMIKESGGFDMAIVRVKDLPDSTQIKIKNKNEFGGPTQIVVSRDSIDLYKTWVQSNKKKFAVNIPKLDYNTITLKHGDYFPETELSNNVFRKDKWRKTKIKLSPVGDIQVPEFQQLFVWPNANWNNYDKLQLGVRLTNETVFPQDFVFKATPMYSFGSGKIVGGASFLYKYLLYKSNVFREIDFYAGTGLGHFQQGLEYYKYSGGVNFKFKKDVLSTKDYYVQIGFEDIQRQLPQEPSLIEIDLKRYQLLNTQLVYRNYQTISESTGRMNVQYSNKFAKLSTEFYHRWKLSKNRRMGVRAFAGIFFNHKFKATKFYDYGLDRITDYTYSYNLLGRSEEKGILSQQFVMAEGGFKSLLGAKANKLMFTLNLEYPIIKMLDVYADAGMYQNKDDKAHFVYDTGIRLSLVPDFVELYFPMQSTLGFEPAMPQYFQRIRFLLNINLSRIRGYWRERKLQL